MPEDVPLPQEGDQDDNNSVQDAPNLTEAIMLMTTKLKNWDSKKPNVKAKEPDTFDGSDPKC